MKPEIKENSLTRARDQLKEEISNLTERLKFLLSLTAKTKEFKTYLNGKRIECADQIRCLTEVYNDFVIMAKTTELF